jgi:hypothetical protein
MPIEIRELNIRTFINEPPQQGAGGGTGAGSAAGEGSGVGRALPDEQRDEIISACVEQVLQILKDKEDR